MESSKSAETCFPDLTDATSNFFVPKKHSFNVFPEQFSLGTVTDFYQVFFQLVSYRWVASTTEKLSSYGFFPQGLLACTVTENHLFGKQTWICLRLARSSVSSKFFLAFSSEIRRIHTVPRNCFPVDLMCTVQLLSGKFYFSVQTLFCCILAKMAL